MRKSAAAAVLVLALTLPSCGDDSPTDPDPGPVGGPAQLTVQVSVGQATVASNLPQPTGPAVQTRVVNVTVTVTNSQSSVAAHIEDVRIFGAILAGQTAYAFSSSGAPPEDRATVEGGLTQAISRSLEIDVGEPFELDDAFDVSAEVTFTDQLGNGGTTPAVSTSVDPVLTLPPGSCSQGGSVDCVDIGGDGRFRVQVDWADVAGGTPQPATVGQQFNDGAFWFFGPNDTELLVQLVDGCSTNDHFWVFMSAITNVEITILVTDTQTNVFREYRNPFDEPFGAVQDTEAFATCPGPVPVP